MLFATPVVEPSRLPRAKHIISSFPALLRRRPASKGRDPASPKATRTNATMPALSQYPHGSRKTGAPSCAVRTKARSIRKTVWTRHVRLPWTIAFPSAAMAAAISPRPGGCISF